MEYRGCDELVDDSHHRLLIGMCDGYRMGNLLLVP